METCPHCGASVSVGDKRCVECGKKITLKKTPVYKGKSYFFHRVVSFVIPILGFIISAQQRHSDPLASKIARKWSVAGLLAYLLAFGILVLFYLYIIIEIIT